MHRRAARAPCRYLSMPVARPTRGARMSPHTTPTRFHASHGSPKGSRANFHMGQPSRGTAPSAPFRMGSSRRN
jgi:hypothetical protein